MISFYLRTIYRIIIYDEIVKKQDSFSHEEHEESQRNTKKDERRREIYIKET